MAATVLLLPNQWFDTPLIRALVAAARRHGAPTIVVWEDPVFYGDRGGSPLRLNKLRLAHHYVGHRELVARLQAAFTGVAVRHVTVDALWPLPARQRYAELGASTVVLYDPCDTLFMDRLTAACAAPPVVLASPSFLMTSAECLAFGAGRKRLQQRPFFELVKKKMGVLEGVPSQDAANRRPFPKDAPMPPAPRARGAAGGPAWTAAADWLRAHPVFGKNPGSPVPPYPLPTTPREARAWLARFLRERLEQFGPYEDALPARDGAHWLYHSGLSTFLNRGLLTPAEVVRAVLATHAPLASVEGFLRQLMGWREYARMYYLCVPPAAYRKNVFGMRAAALSSEWYDAAPSRSALPPPVRAAVTDAWATGYLHHIRRLMVLSNYLTLAGAHPDAVYRWMYEFALDSDAWVMVFNVYGMGTWSDGGIGMRKPYVSSSNYLIKMGAERGPWTADWDAKYAAFLRHHAGVLKHTVLAQRGAGVPPTPASTMPIDWSMFQNLPNDVIGKITSQPNYSSTL